MFEEGKVYRLKSESVHGFLTAYAINKKIYNIIKLNPFLAKVVADGK